MTFKQKIDKILSINTFGVNTVNGMEAFVKASTGAIKKFYDDDREAGPATLRKIKKAFGISNEQWQAGDFTAGGQKASFWDEITEGDYIGMHKNVWAQVEATMKADREWISQLITKVVDSKG